MIASLIRPGDCFWDIGAHKGYITLIAARRVGKRGRVYAVEPANANLWYLRRHLRWNGVENVTVVPVAVSNFDGLSRFGGGSSLAFKLGKGKDLVPVRSVRSLIESGDCEPPTFLKIDTEGAEADILAGAGRYLENRRLMILISVHSPDLYAACSNLLRDRGFRVIESGPLVAACRAAWQQPFSRDGRSDPDLLAIGSECLITEQDLEWFVSPESTPVEDAPAATVM
jgi:FkbM family methyltransferase